jgi:deazaflavin-dependent oxidoreductase (nitroreductase family)
MSRLNRGMMSRYGGISKAGSRLLVLKTIGWKTGQLRSTPLQYEELDGVYYVASARGTQADWYRNLIACPNVEVMVREKSFSTIAQPMTNSTEIANFLELRLRRHPLFMGVMLRLEGLPRKYSRSDLENFSKRLAIVILEQPKV